jgi:predicted enzyme related to lactoylglutathione lyase
MAGKPVHVELPAKDSARAKQFYTSLFGWQFQTFGDVDYHMTQFDEQTGGAIYGDESGEASHPRVYFDVDDIDQATAKVRELGGQADDKQPVPGMGWYAGCKDTEGTSFNLWQSDDSAPAPEGGGSS